MLLDVAGCCWILLPSVKVTVKVKRVISYFVAGVLFNLSQRIGVLETFTNKASEQFDLTGMSSSRQSSNSDPISIGYPIFGPDLQLLFLSIKGKKVH